MSERLLFTIRCPKTFEDVSVPQLLYGWGWRTQDIVLSRLEQIDDGANLKITTLYATPQLDEGGLKKVLTPEGIIYGTKNPISSQLSAEQTLLLLNFTQ